MKTTKEIIFDRMLKTAKRVAAESRLAIRDLESLQDLHRGEPAWQWLEAELPFWRQSLQYAERTLAELRRVRSDEERRALNAQPARKRARSASTRTPGV